MTDMFFSDTELLAAIQQDGVHRDKALQQVYQDAYLRRVIKAYVTTHSGTLPDVEDVFQDTVILFDRQIREGNFQGQSSWQTYFIGIAKWRWVSMKRKLGREVEFKPEYYDSTIESVEARVLENEKRDIIDAILSKIGERCKTILQLYKLSYSMEEIAKVMDLSSPEMAKKNAYECRKKFKEYLKNDKEYLNILNTNYPTIKK